VTLMEVQVGKQCLNLEHDSKLGQEIYQIFRKQSRKNVKLVLFLETIVYCSLLLFLVLYKDVICIYSQRLNKYIYLAI